jgi:hypothetical protein
MKEQETTTTPAQTNSPSRVALERKKEKSKEIRRPIYPKASSLHESSRPRPSSNPVAHASFFPRSQEIIQ